MRWVCSSVLDGKNKARVWMANAATAQLFVQERHFSRALKETLVSKRRGAAAPDGSQLLFTGRLTDRCRY